MAFCLVPLEELDNAWLPLDADSPPIGHPAHEQLDRFKHYFINTWMENPNYPRVLWNHFGFVSPTPSNNHHLP